ncbi:MAG: LamG-like jellyroll fold domain-containing protein [Planctomycetota bacterium]
MRTFDLAAIVALGATATAQDFIHYKFDANCTNEVINLASGPAAFPANGVFESNTSPQFVAGPLGPTGPFGQALAGGSAAANLYNRVRTGWTPSLQPLTGDLTYAFFAKERTVPGTALNYLCGVATSANRLFTNGIASRGLYFRNIVAGGPTGLDLSALTAVLDFQTLAAAGWVHIAIVVDTATTTATWYANGLSVQVTSGVSGGLINSAGEYLVGFQLTGNESNYDLDEFLISNRAYTAAEVLALATVPHAGDGDYRSGIASQCGAGNAALTSSGGAPFVGNLGYSLDVSATSPSLYVLLAGFDRCLFGGVLPLPLDGTPLTPLLAGCWILADAPVTLGGAVLGPPATNPLPIPITVPPGTAIYSQALVLDAATFATSMSSGFATGIGF